MNVRNILSAALVALALTACEDYNEHNFGTDRELYSPTETSNYSLSMGRTDYVTTANNAKNLETAIALGTDSLGNVDSIYYRALQQVAIAKCFNNLTPVASYLPAFIDEKLPYATDGATVTVTVKEDTIPYVQYPAYIRLEKMRKGTYLVAPDKVDSCYFSTQEEENGYLQASPVNRFSASAIGYAAELESALLTFTREDDHYLISNATGSYLCTEEGSDDIYFCSDLGNLDDGAQAHWVVNMISADSCMMQNLYTQAYLCWDQTAGRGCVTADISETMSPMLGIYKYTESNPNADQTSTSTKKSKYVFVKKDGVWQIKDSYIDLTLTGNSSTDAAAIRELTGFTIAIVDMPSTLTYVWKLDAMYGLRASAYASSTCNVTEAWAVTPSIDLSTASAPCVLQFDQAQKYAGDCSQELTVWITTDDVAETSEMDPENYNWNQLVIDTYPDGSSWDFITTTLDLSEYAGQPNVHIGLRYVRTSSYAATWEVKNFVVKNAN